MKKYILMVVAVVGASILGGVGVVYSLVASAPFVITRQNDVPVATANATGLAAGAAQASMTITVR